jgi:hypothetical protein
VLFVSNLSLKNYHIAKSFAQACRKYHGSNLPEIILLQKRACVQKQSLNPFQTKHVCKLTLVFNLHRKASVFLEKLNT